MTRSENQSNFISTDNKTEFGNQASLLILIEYFEIQVMYVLSYQHTKNDLRSKKFIFQSGSKHLGNTVNSSIEDELVFNF